mgnify:CR=1 FL=1
MMEVSKCAALPTKYVLYSLFSMKNTSMQYSLVFSHYKIFLTNTNNFFFIQERLKNNSFVFYGKALHIFPIFYFPENSRYLHRSFTVRFRCLLDNTSGFIVSIEISLDALYILNNRHYKNKITEIQGLSLQACKTIKISKGRYI